MSVSLKLVQNVSGLGLDKITYMPQSMRAAGRYGTVKRLVFGYVCPFSTFAYIFESLDNLCFFVFFFQKKNSLIIGSTTSTS